MMKKYKLDIRAMVQVALLIAIEIVLSRFCSIATPVVKIGFGFVPIAVCGMLYGPLWAGVAGGSADLVGAVLFPIGAYFPGFTISAVLTGVIFGLLLHKEKASWPRLALAVGVNCLGISLCLSTFWLTLLTGSPFLGLLPPRIVQNLIMIPIQFTVLRLMQHPVTLYQRRMRHA